MMTAHLGRIGQTKLANYNENFVQKKRCHMLTGMTKPKRFTKNVFTKFA
jgi:hypothetical protein